MIAMKTVTAFALVSLVAISPCRAQSAARQACNVEVDVTDPDPKGTNVRTEPGGSVVAALKNPSDDGWVLVHLTAQVGDWYEIDRARLIDPGQEHDKVIFQGRGFVHRSVVGVGGLQNGAVIYDDHTTKGSVVDAHAAGDQKVDLLGCFADFVKVRVRKGVGWTKQICTNMVTTCS